MQKLDITEILQNILATVHSHKLGNGQYARYKVNENSAMNAYGCADAANILYSLRSLPKDQEEKNAFVAAIQSFQDPVSGYFKEGSHHEIHTTAHCTAALELFNALPLYPFSNMEKYLEAGQFERYMTEELDFLHRGKASHVGAGIYAAFSITGKVSPAFKRTYFEFFDRTCNPKTGLWEKDPAPEFTRHLQIGDSFHFYFNYSEAHRAFPYPEALIDSCLDAYRNNAFGEPFGRRFHFIEMDWIYCLNRSTYQTAHRFDEVKSTLYEFAEGYISCLKGMDYKTNYSANDLHLLFGGTCALAELQKALPGIIVSDISTRQVLDSRPFI